MRPAVRSWNLAQAARSPGCAATRATRATTEPEPDATESDAEPAAAATTEATATSAATKPATTATMEAAAPAAATAPSAATATTATAGYLHAATKAFPIEEMERGEADVGHFLFAKHEALIGRGIVKLRNTGSRHRGCGCTKIGRAHV